MKARRFAMVLALPLLALPIPPASGAAGAPTPAGSIWIAESQSNANGRLRLVHP